MSDSTATEGAMESNQRLKVATPFSLYDEDSGAPVCQPLETLDEVLSWQPGHNPAARATVKLDVENWDRSWKERPRTVVCHDMAGGYLHDRFLQGTDKDDAYCFYHWQYVDIFIYFSHYFVTLPPPCWTNMAHKHGTLMLGTIITEWKIGKERCEQFLKDTESYEAFADNLVALAEYYAFDGWLINIENVVQEDQVSNLVGFVEYLTQKMHESQPHSVVLWYDSVINNGKLKWQNELNDLNRCFFDVSDGLFVNYTWTSKHLQRSSDLAKQCHRQYDVYVGVDVFGRGCLGDGGFNTQEAVAAARDMSIALFAQGWVYETQGKEDFLNNENRFWSLLKPYCRHHGYHGLPFASHFCIGQGHRFYCNGKVVSDKTWTNLSAQSLQPTFTQTQFTDTDPSNKPTMAIWRQDAFQGGNCLKLSAPNSTDFRLFSVHIDTAKPLLVSYTYKPTSMGQGDKCCLQMKLTGSTTSVIHLGDRESETSKPLLKSDGDQPLEKEASQKTREQKDEDVDIVYLSPLTLSETQQLCGKFDVTENTGWMKRYYKLEGMESGVLEEISFNLFKKNSTAEKDLGARVLECLLGQIQVMRLEDATEVPLVTNLVLQRTGSARDVCLQWTFPQTVADHFMVYGSEDNKDSDSDSYTLLGASHATCYHIAASNNYAWLKVQPVLRNGFTVPLTLCPSVSLSLCQI